MNFYEQTKTFFLAFLKEVIESLEYQLVLMRCYTLTFSCPTKCSKFGLFCMHGLKWFKILVPEPKKLFWYQCSLAFQTSTEENV